MRIFALVAAYSLLAGCKTLVPYDSEFACQANQDFGRCMNVQEAYDDALGTAADAEKRDKSGKTAPKWEYRSSGSSRGARDEKPVVFRLAVGSPDLCFGPVATLPCRAHRLLRAGAARQSGGPARRLAGRVSGWIGRIYATAQKPNTRESRRDLGHIYYRPSFRDDVCLSYVRR